jgi:phosphate transport system substrate-binding protein
MMNRASIILSVAVLSVTSLLMPGRAMADTEIRVKGSTSLGKPMKAKQSAIETAAGVKLNIVANGSGNGLADLTAGNADISMISAPLPEVVEEYNKKHPGGLSADGLKAFVVSSSEICPIVGPDNTVASLTVDQVRDIFSGKIQNWKDLGGTDQPIVLVLPPNGDGPRSTIENDVLHGASFGKGARVTQLAPDVLKIVPQIPGAVSFIVATGVSPTVKALKVDKPVETTMSLVTKGEPTDTQKKIIDATKDQLK